MSCPILDEFLKQKQELHPCPSPDELQHVGNLMKATLQASGLRLDGSEAQAIHGKVFTLVFATSKCASQEFRHNTGKGQSVTVAEYFQILCQPALGWMAFFEQLLPLLQLSLTSRVVSSLHDYLSTVPVQDCKLCHIRPLVCALSSTISILLDFLENPDASGAEVKECDDALPVEVQSTLVEEMKALSQGFESCLALLLTFLDNSNIVQLAQEERSDFNKLCACLLSTLAILDPERNISSLKSFLEENLSGKENVHTEKSVVKSTDNSANPKQKGMKISKDEQFEMSEIDLQRFVDEDVKAVKKDDAFWTLNSLFENAVLLFRSNVARKRFFQVAKLFSRGTLIEGDPFYKSLVEFILKTDLCVGRHVLKGDKVYPVVLSRLVSLSKESDRESILVKYFSSGPELEEVASQWTESMPEELADFRRLKMSKVEKVLEEGGELGSASDLELVREAVHSKERGWYELLCLGLRNKDIKTWWAQGFYELVWEREAVLCTLDNVSQVMGVLLTALAAGDEHWTTQLHKLVSIMFRRLPSPLQEQLVYRALVRDQPEHDEGLSENVFSSRAGHFGKLISKELVASELTPMLNKLTSFNVPKMMGEILWLCLFSLDTVLQHLVQTAVENKGQVKPVVQVLQSCHTLTSLPSSSSSQRPQSMLCQALQEHIMGTSLTDSQCKNLVQFLTALSQHYKRAVEGLNPGASVLHPPVLAVGDLMGAIVEPGLERACVRTSEPCQPKQLSLDVLLTLLVNLMDSDLSNQDFVQLKPLCLFILVCDLYVAYTDLWVEGELDKQKVKVKQVALKCAAGLTSRIYKCREMFTDSQLTWLVDKSSRSSLVHVVLAWPALTGQWDTQVAGLIDKLAGDVFQNSEKTVSVLALLLQLSSLNDKASSQIVAALEKQKMSIESQVLAALVRHLFKMCVPVEMALAMPCVRSLLAIHSSGDAALQDRDTATQWIGGNVVAQSSSTLRDALLGLLRWEMSESSLSHILLNYQAALQAVVQTSRCDLCTLTHVLCDILEILTFISDPSLAQILQVTVLDVFGQFEVAFREEGARRKEMEKEAQADRQGGSEERQREKEEIEKDESSVDDESDMFRIERRTDKERKTKVGVEERESASLEKGDGIERVTEMVKEWKKRDKELAQNLRAHIKCVAEESVRTVLHRKLQEIVC